MLSKQELVSAVINFPEIDDSEFSSFQQIAYNKLYEVYRGKLLKVAEPYSYSLIRDMGSDAGLKTTTIEYDYYELSMERGFDYSITDCIPIDDGFNLNQRGIFTWDIDDIGDAYRHYLREYDFIFFDDGDDSLEDDYDAAHEYELDNEWDENNDEYLEERNKYSEQIRNIALYINALFFKREKLNLYGETLVNGYMSVASYVETTIKEMATYVGISYEATLESLPYIFSLFWPPTIYDNEESLITDNISLMTFHLSGLRKYNAYRDQIPYGYRRVMHKLVRFLKYPFGKKILPVSSIENDSEVTFLYLNLTNDCRILDLKVPITYSLGVKLYELLMERVEKEIVIENKAST